MFEFGEITDIDAPRGYVKVYIPETGNTTEWIPFMRSFYTQSIPFEINEQVAVIFNQTGRGLVIGSTPNNIDKPYTGASAKKYGIKFSDDTLLEYDIASHKLTINTVGDVDIISATKVSIDAVVEVDITAPIIKLTGAVTVIGLLTATEGLSATGPGVSVTGGGGITTDGTIEASGDVIANTISLQGHKHSGVSAGSAITGPAV